MIGAVPEEPQERISCRIPGHDRPGDERLTEGQLVDEPPLHGEVTGKGGFASDVACGSG